MFYQPLPSTPRGGNPSFFSNLFVSSIVRFDIPKIRGLSDITLSKKEVCL